MKILNGWGWDKKIIDDGGFTEVRILDKDEDVMYISTRDKWLTHGIVKNFGHGEQIILPLRHHEVRNRKQPKML